ncbi:hypothetical protein LINPERHAP1_LOCUS24546, partial [Linum perenne]
MGVGSVTAKRPPTRSRSPAATRFQLPLREGKGKEGDKDEEGKSGRRRKKKKEEKR